MKPEERVRTNMPPHSGSKGGLRVGETQKPRTRTLGSGLRDAVKGFVGTIPDAQQFVRRWLPASKGPQEKAPTE